MSRRQDDGVRGVVQRRTDVVAHAAVDRYIRTQALERLDGADLVERERSWSDDGAARLYGESWLCQTRRSTLAAHDLAQGARDVGRSLRVVGGDVRDPEATTKVDQGQLDAVVITNRGEQANDPVRGNLETRGIEDL